MTGFDLHVLAERTASGAELVLAASAAKPPRPRGRVWPDHPSVCAPRRLPLFRIYHQAPSAEKSYQDVLARGARTPSICWN